MATTSDNINILFDNFMRELNSSVKEANEKQRILEKLQALLGSKQALNNTRNQIQRHGAFSAPKSSSVVGKTEDIEKTKMQKFFKDELSLGTDINTVKAVCGLYENIAKFPDNALVLGEKISDKVAELRTASASSSLPDSRELRAAFQSGLDKKYHGEDNIQNGPNTVDELRAKLPGVPEQTKQALGSLLANLQREENTLSGLQAAAPIVKDEWDEVTTIGTPEIQSKKSFIDKLRNEYNQAYRAALATVPASIAADRKPSKEKVALMTMSKELTTSLQSLKTVQFRAKKRDLELMIDRHRKASAGGASTDITEANEAEHTAFLAELNPLRLEKESTDSKMLLLEGLEEKVILIKKAFLEKAILLAGRAKTNAEDAESASRSIEYSQPFFRGLDSSRDDIESEYTEDMQETFQQILEDYKTKCNKVHTLDDLMRISAALTLPGIAQNETGYDSEDEDEDTKLEAERTFRQRSGSTSSMSRSFTMSGSTMLVRDIFSELTQAQRLELADLKDNLDTLFTDNGHPMPGLNIIEKAIPVQYQTDTSPNKDKTKQLKNQFEGMTIADRKSLAASLVDLKQLEVAYFFSLYQDIPERNRKQFLTQWSGLDLANKQALLNRITRDISDETPQKRALLFTLLSTVSQAEILPVINRLKIIADQNFEQDDNDFLVDALDDLLSGNLSPDVEQDGHTIMRILANIHGLALTMQQGINPYIENKNLSNTIPVEQINDTLNEFEFHENKIITTCATLNRLLKNPSLTKYCNTHPNAKKALANIIEASLDIEETITLDNFTFAQTQQEYLNEITIIKQQFQKRLADSKPKEKTIQKPEDIKRALDVPPSAPASGISMTTATPSASSTPASVISMTTETPNTPDVGKKPTRKLKTHDYLDAAPSTQTSSTSSDVKESKRASATFSPEDSKLARVPESETEEPSNHLALKTLEAENQRLQAELNNTRRADNALQIELQVERTNNATLQQKLNQAEVDLSQKTSTPSVREAELTHQMNLERQRFEEEMKRMREEFTRQMQLETSRNASALQQAKEEVVRANDQVAQQRNLSGLDKTRLTEQLQQVQQENHAIKNETRTSKEETRQKQLQLEGEQRQTAALRNDVAREHNDYVAEHEALVTAKLRITELQAAVAHERALFEAEHKALDDANRQIVTLHADVAREHAAYGADHAALNAADLRIVDLQAEVTHEHALYAADHKALDDANRQNVALQADVAREHAAYVDDHAALNAATLRIADLQAEVAHGHILFEAERKALNEANAQLNNLNNVVVPGLQAAVLNEQAAHGITQAALNAEQIARATAEAALAATQANLLLAQGLAAQVPVVRAELQQARLDLQAARDQVAALQVQLRQQAVQAQSDVSAARKDPTRRKG